MVWWRSLTRNCELRKRVGKHLRTWKDESMEEDMKRTRLSFIESDALRDNCTNLIETAARLLFRYCKNVASEGMKIAINLSAWRLRRGHSRKSAVELRFIYDSQPLLNYQVLVVKVVNLRNSIRISDLRKLSQRCCQTVERQSWCLGVNHPRSWNISTF